MPFLKKLRISTKVLALLALCAVLCASLVWSAAYNLDRISHVIGDMNSTTEALRSVRVARERMITIHQLAFQLDAVAPADAKPVEDKLLQQFAGLKSDLGALGKAIDAGDATAYGAAITGANQYVAMETANRALLRQGKRKDAEALLLSTGVPAFDRADAALTKLIARHVRDFPIAAAIIQRRAQGAIAFLMVTSTLGLLTIFGLALVIVRREITKPLALVMDAMSRLSRGEVETTLAAANRRDEIGDLARTFDNFRQAAIDKLKVEKEAHNQRQMVEGERRKNYEAQAIAAKQQTHVVESLAAGLTQLAAGNLLYRIEEPFPESSQKLRADFNTAINQLQETMKLIKSAVFEMHSGTSEISQSAEDLSRRTETQAASLEESAATLSEITASVRRMAEGAAEANGAVGSAKVDAERSGKVMHEAVNAMSGIEQSARKISQIIGVIDEIAFQTTLLALNAGVEAARAGDAGRGFAVVASEVRALAQRSAASAKEIKALISTSTDEVGVGVQLVGQTGKALDSIVVNIAEINRRVAEIAVSAKEQAAGLHEINSAIDQMDQVTQQNASMVEENTAASLDLASQSQQLADLLGRFVIDENAEATALPGRRTPVSIRAVNGPVRPQRHRPNPRPSASRAGGAATAKKMDPSEDSWEEF